MFVLKQPVPVMGCLGSSLVFSLPDTPLRSYCRLIICYPVLSRIGTTQNYFCASFKSFTE